MKKLFKFAIIVLSLLVAMTAQAGEKQDAEDMVKYKPAYIFLAENYSDLLDDCILRTQKNMVYITSQFKTDESAEMAVGFSCVAMYASAEAEVTGEKARYNKIAYKDYGTIEKTFSKHKLPKIYNTVRATDMAWRGLDDKLEIGKLARQSWALKFMTQISFLNGRLSNE